jgi:hypothetical protein
MNRETDREAKAIPHRPGRWSIIGATVASLAAWLLTATALVGAVSFTPGADWPQTAFMVVLCGAPQGALWAARHARRSRLALASVTEPILEQRLHGELDAISDNACRPLRPIGMSASDVARQTRSLLIELIKFPSVRIFQGVRTHGTHSPPTAHAVTAGKTIIFVESVAWPPGTYTLGNNGRVSCDGRYIGQSVRPLLDVVSHWRDVLPRNHRVFALVVVHRTETGQYVLPVAKGHQIALVHAEDALGEITRRVARRRHVSTHTIAALVAATESS